MTWSVGFVNEYQRSTVTEEGLSDPSLRDELIALGLDPGAIVVSHPLPVDVQLDPALHDTVLAEGLAAVARLGITGKAVTPYLLAHFHEATQGASLEVNVEVVLRNATLAARIAAAYATGP